MKSMDPETPRATIEEIGVAIDRAVRALRVWRRDRATALFYLLTVFEDAVRIPLFEAVRRRDWDILINSDTLRRNFEDGLTEAVRIAYERCPEPGNRVPTDPFDSEYYREMFRALALAAQYHDVVGAIEDALNGWQQVRVRGRDVWFSYPVTHAMDIEVSSELAELYDTASRPSRPHPVTPLHIFRLPERDQADLISLISKSLRRESSETISYQAPPRLKDFFHQLAERGVEVDELPPDISVNGYSLWDACQFYRALYRRAAMNQCYCYFSGKVGVPGHGVGNLVPMLTRTDIESDLAHTGTIGSDRLERILNDLIYDPNLKRADVFFQPLLEIRPDTYLYSPILVTASKWERNIQRLWARKHPAEWAGVQSRVKGRLADALADVFRSCGFVAQSNRPLSLPGEALVAEADLTVFDRRENVLLEGVRLIGAYGKPWW